MSGSMFMTEAERAAVAAGINLFSVLQLTEAINRVPRVPSLLMNMRLFEPRPMTVTDAAIERRDNRLALVPDQPRGGVASRNVMGQRGLLTLPVPHFPLRDTIMADSIQNVRTFGDDQLTGFHQALNERMEAMSLKHDATLEFLRLGAVKGVIITAVDRDTGAPLREIDLFAQFGIAPPEPIPFPIAGPAAQTAEASWTGAVMHACRAVARQMQTALGSQPPAISAVCGSDFFDALVLHPEVRATFLATPDAGTLRERRLFVPTFYGGIEFHDGGAEQVGGVPFVAPDEAHFFARNVAGLFVEAYAPADYVDTVNTLAMARYARQDLLPMGKGVELETQQNVLPLCTQPETLLVGKLVNA